MTEVVLSDPVRSVPFPPAPWHSRGGFWVGGFRSDRPAILPAPLSPIAPRLLIIALIRYLSGTLRYDELIVGSVARHGLRIGLHVHGIWVDDRLSLRGGRAIWGLPKELATFAWNGSHVRISDARGSIATLEVDQTTALLPRLPLVAPFFGDRNGDLIHTIAPATGRLGRAGMRLHDWSDRFAWRIGARPLLAIAGKPFRMIVPGPRTIVQR